jgi:hypothetical protein
MPTLPATAPFSGQLVVNGITLTDIDTSHGLSVSNVAGHLVVNGVELPVPDAAAGLTLSGMTSITNTDTGAADASGSGNGNGNGGVEITGIVIGNIDSVGGPVLLDLANTGSADASSSLVVHGAPAFDFGALSSPAVEHAALGMFSLPDFGPDWLFR